MIVAVRWHPNGALVEAMDSRGDLAEIDIDALLDLFVRHSGLEEGDFEAEAWQPTERGGVWIPDGALCSGSTYDGHSALVEACSDLEGVEEVSQEHAAEALCVESTLEIDIGADGDASYPRREE